MSDDKQKEEKKEEKQESTEEVKEEKQEESSDKQEEKEEKKEDKPEQDSKDDKKEEDNKQQVTNSEQESNDSEEAGEDASSGSSAQPSAEGGAVSGEDVEIPEKFQDIVEKIESMSVLDLNDLVKLLEKKFGVSAVAAAAPVAGGAEGGGEEEKDSFTVELTAIGNQKIGVIKAVKGALGLGLKEAKELVEGAPVALKEDMPKADAEALKSSVEEAGGTVELK